MTEQRNSRIALLAVVMLLSGAFLGLVVSNDASAAKYNINSIVKDADGTGISGVSVTILDRDSGYTKSTTTLNDGFYAFTNVNDGDYDIRYSKIGYLSIRDNLTISSSGSIESVNMDAAPSGDISISGNVTGDGFGVSGATVTLFSTDVFEDSWWGYADIGYSWSVTTNETGYYSFSEMPGVTFDARVDSDDHYTKNWENVDFTLDTELQVSNVTDANNQNINVKDNLGNIISDAKVFMYEASTSTWTEATKFGGATYILSPNTGSTVYVYAYHEDHKPVVTKLSDIGDTNSFEMILGENNLGDDDIIYIPGLPTHGSQTDLPELYDRTVKLNMGPTAKISSNNDDYVVTDGGAINFSASGSFSVVGITSYDWGNDNTDVTYNSTFTGNPNVVSLTVTDNFGDTDTVTVNVTADADNPVASFSAIVKTGVNDNGTAVNSTNVFEDAPYTVVFNASESSDVTSSVVSYSWDFGDENTDTGKVVSHVFTDPGIFNTVLTVTDAAGNTDTESLLITVHDITEPNVFFNFSYVDSEGIYRENAAMEGVPIAFNAGLTTDNSGGDLTYEWDFSDSTIANGKEVTHTFDNVTAEGYEVTLVVTDEAGNTAQMMMPIYPSEMSRPDLFISKVIFSNENPLEDSSVDITAVLKLQKMNVSDDIEVAFYLNNMDNQIGALSVDGSSLSKEVGSEYNATISWKAIAGTHTIFAVVDPNDMINEGNSEAALKNNEFAKDIVVTEKEESNDTSIILLVLVVVISIGAVGYIYKDSLFGK